MEDNPQETQPPTTERHAAVDRFGKIALRMAHDLAEAGSAEDPIVVRTDGPHRSIDGLAALIDAALAEEGPGAEPVDGRSRTADERDALPPS